jgi:hypothetical protein
MVLSLPPTAEGVLPGHLLERAIRAGYVDAGRFKIPESNIQPASLDLRLGERALRIRCSFLPGDDTVERKLKDYILDEIDLRGSGAMLEARCPYLIELKERLDLPAGLRGKANPKSSTGRIDVFTRVITDHSDRFDEYVNLGTSGLRVSRVCLGMMGFGNEQRPALGHRRGRGGAHRPGRRRGRGHLLRHRRHLFGGASEVATGKAGPKFLSRDEAVIATKVFMPVTPGENGGGLSRKHILSGIDASLERLGHGLRRPVPDPPLGSPDAHRGDHGACTTSCGPARRATSGPAACSRGSSPRRSTRPRRTAGPSSSPCRTTTTSSTGRRSAR